MTYESNNKLLYPKLPKYNEKSIYFIKKKIILFLFSNSFNA